MDRVLASGAECMLVTPNFMCAYVSHALQEEGLRAIARDAGRVQNEGILACYVAAARAEAERRRVPIADAFARWQALASAGTPQSCSPTTSTIPPARRMGCLWKPYWRSFCRKTNPFEAEGGK